MKKRKFWGWGYEDQLLTEEEDKSIETHILLKGAKYSVNLPAPQPISNIFFPFKK